MADGSPTEYLWSALDALGRFTIQWHSFLVGLPKEVVANASTDVLAGEDMSLANRVKEVIANYEPSGWEAHIDGFMDFELFGWAKKLDEAAPQSVIVRAYGYDVGVEVLADLERKDLESLNFGSEKYGYQLKLAKFVWQDTFCCISVHDSQTNKLLGFRFFDAASSFSDANCHFLAGGLSALGKAKLAVRILDHNVLEAEANYQEFARIVNEMAARGQYQLADVFYSLYCSVLNTYCISYALFPLKNTALSHKDALIQSISRVYKHHIVPKTNVEITDLANLFNEILQLDSNKIFAILYDNFMKNYIWRCETYIDFIMDKFLICMHLRSHLQYLNPIANSLKFNLFDILFFDNSLSSIELPEAFQNAKILSNFNEIHTYKAIFIDNEIAQTLGTTLRDYPGIKIGFLHATYSNTPRYLPIYLDMMLYMNSKSLCDNHFIGMSHTQINIPFIRKSSYYCELSYTGPFHLDDGKDYAKISKEEAKNLLAEKLLINFHPDKPLLVCYHGALTDLKQLFYCLNKLSKYFNIIFKRHAVETDKYNDRLNDNIIIYPSKKRAENILKYAADFVLCEYCKSTYISTFVTGVPVIPFYSRCLTGRIALKGATFNHYHQDIKCWPYHKFLDANYLQPFDVIDWRRIKDTILDPDFSKWYFEKLPFFREQLFGDYMVEGSAQKTAEYILRFMSEGTLGIDCKAICLK